MKRLHLMVEGRVHGVGFRYFTRQVALENSLSGWVRNLPDGRVEVLMEGEESSLSIALSTLREGPPSAVVATVHDTWSQATGEFESFDIR